MKHIVKRIMVLFIAVLLTMPDYAFAQEPEIIVVADGEAFVFNDVVSEYVEPNVGEAEAGPGGEGEPQSQAEVPAATYRFSAGEEPVVELVFRDGEEIIPPEDPTAPEGEVFAGWFLEDGTPLFADEDHTARVDPSCPFINVYARFEIVAQAGMPVIPEVGALDGAEIFEDEAPDGAETPEVGVPDLCQHLDNTRKGCLASPEPPRWSGTLAFYLRPKLLVYSLSNHAY